MAEWIGVLNSLISIPSTNKFFKIRGMLIVGEQFFFEKAQLSLIANLVHLKKGDYDYEVKSFCNRKQTLSWCHLAQGDLSS